MAVTHGRNFYFIQESGDGSTDGQPSRSFRLGGKENAPRFTLEIKELENPMDDGQRTVAAPSMNAAERKALEALFSRVQTQGSISPASLWDSSGELTGFEYLQIYDNIIPPNSDPIKQLSDDLLVQLGTALTKHVPQEQLDPVQHKIPAGYTYFGQLLAHDMSNMTWVQDAIWAGGNGSGGWKNAENLHALDFSSLFGTSAKSGPPTSVWEERAGSALGLAALAQPGFERAVDLPRAGANGLHCCSDQRADGNLALAQMHVLMIRFHQAAALELDLDGVAAQDVTRRHLQAVVLTDYLPRIVPQDVYDDVMQNERKLVNTAASDFFVPIEFAAACFRFGHSMVRDSYAHWVIDFPPGSDTTLQVADLSSLIHYTAEGGGLNNKQLTFSWAQAWRHMVENTNSDLPDTLMARRIKASIDPAFGNLERSHFKDAKDKTLTGQFNLAVQTLRRGAEIGLPSGQELETLAGMPDNFDIAEFLDDKRLRFGTLADDLNLQTKTPIWFFVLAEAEALGGGKLGPLGGRLVMETFHAALEASEQSIISVSNTNVTDNIFQRELRTGFGPCKTFTLGDVVAVANGGID